MKITYHPNPLNTTVELEEHERELLLHKIKIRELTDSLFTLYYNLERKPEEVKKTTKDWQPDIDQINEDAAECLELYLAELKSPHCGDCICVACTCDKCHAEELLGIDTLGPNGKHVNHYINIAFTYREGNEWKHRTPAEALEWLRTYEPRASWTGWEAYAETWKKNSDKAFAYLLEYNRTHNFGE